MAGQTSQSASLTGLPTELRLKILEQLLPAPIYVDDKLFQCAKAYTNDDRLEHCKNPPKGHNCDKWIPPCNTNILRVNRRLYEDGLSVLYHRTCSIYMNYRSVVLCGKNWIRTCDRSVAEDFGLAWRLSHITKLRIQVDSFNTHVVKYLIAVLRETGGVKDLTLVVRDGNRYGPGFNIKQLKPFNTLRNLRKFSIEKQNTDYVPCFGR